MGCHHAKCSQMIPFDQFPEPPDFDVQVRQPGMRWLERNRNKRPKNLWRRCLGQLAQAFHNLCAYTAMYEPVGTVDHYLSCENHRILAYEWNNYRYAAQWVNSSKGTLDEQVLDPFEVEENWFQLLLPSMQLVLTDHIPSDKRKKAEDTLEKLHLQNGEAVIRQRLAWYQLYQDGLLTLEGLEQRAPLIARAIRLR